MRAAMRAATVVCVLTACGGGAGTGDDTPQEYTRLIGRTWSVPAGDFDSYKCIRIQIPEDIYVTSFRSLAPAGSHHSVLTIARADNLQMGEYDCSVTSLDLQMLYAAGIGTDDLTFPEGTAVRLRAGQYINLNLHLFNAGETAISGDSAVMVKTVPADAVENEVDMVFAGTFDIGIPPDGQPHTMRGGCTLGADYDVIAWWPHMHQFATHQTVTITSAAGGSVEVLDDDYAFSEQRYYPEMPIRHLSTGDQVEVACTYVNNGPDYVEWGDSSNAEMCFSGMYRYPAGSGILFECTSGSMF
jgi:hypothetical protein